MRSRRSASNLALSSASRSAFFCARQTIHALSSILSYPSSSSTALLAASDSSKHTKPKPLDLPSPSFITTTEVSVPHFSNTSRSMSSVTFSCRFLTYTLLNVLGPPPRSPRRWKGPTYTCLSFISMPFTLLMAPSAASAVSNCTKPYPLLWPWESVATLAETMLPNCAKVSYSALLSMSLSRFLMKMFPTPDLRNAGSRCEYMMRMGLPFTTWKFRTSMARAASGPCWKFTYAYPSERRVMRSRHTRMDTTGPMVEKSS